MAFGQQSGPPASAKQVKDLLGLLQDAGHDDFRDARGPMGFTQRQAAGKFTREEADGFIEQLEGGGDGSGPGGSGPGDAPAPAAAPAVRLTATERAVRALPDAALAAELQRRGWVVMEP
jgi:hypothetical protein